MALVLEGGAVRRPTSVRYWFSRSIRVAVKRSGAEIIGVGAIKPLRQYTETVAQRSGAELHPETHELGYIAVKEEHRGQGISRAIVQTLLRVHDGPLFATTWNAWMRRTLEGVGFVQRGKEWPTTGGGNMLSLWVRPSRLRVPPL